MANRLLSIFLAALMTFGSAAPALAAEEVPSPSATIVADPTSQPAPVDTEAPTDTPAPEMTEAPSDTPAPETTAAPSDTPVPEMTAAPSDTPVPVATEAPEVDADEPVPAAESTDEPAATSTPVPTTSGTCGTHLTWQLESAGRQKIDGKEHEIYTLTISGTGPMTNFGTGAEGSAAQAPWKSGPYNNWITTVRIDSGATSIGSYAFYSLRNLSAVTIPGTVSSIGSYAFSRCIRLGAVALPEGVTTIINSTFSGCSSLTTVSLPASLTTLGTDTFSDCSALSSVSVTAGNSAFSSQNGVLFNADKTTLILYPLGKADASYKIPDGVTSVGQGAFAFCEKLLSISIPGTVTDIGQDAFYSTGIKSVTLPVSLRTIGRSAFQCSALQSVVIPEGVTSLGDGVFAGCPDLRSATIPGTVSAIPASCFSDSGLESVDLPGSIKTIGAYAFTHCDRLQTVRLPGGLESIGNYAFNNCPGLTAVSIPDTVKDIGAGAFSTCDSLSSVKLPAGLLVLNDYTFDNCPQLRSIALPSTLTLIGAQAFSDTGLEEVTLPEGVCSVGYAAFGRCASLKSLTVANPECTFSTLKPQDAEEFLPAQMLGAPGYTVIHADENSNIFQIAKVLGFDESHLQAAPRPTAAPTASPKPTASPAPTASPVPVLAAPKLTAAENTADGVMIRWEPVPGAEAYRVFYKTTGSWKKLADTASTSYLASKAKSGITYTFTVRCVTADGQVYTSPYDKTGLTVAYVAAPRITNLVNTADGIQIQWKAVKGAVKYRVCYRTTGGWKKLADTASTSYLASKAKSGITYTFTIRCISANGKRFTSGFDETGKTIACVAAPRITKLANTAGGIRIQWKAIKGADKYRICYKTTGGWKKLANTTSTSYLAPKAKNGVTYTFTIRCVSANGKRFTSGYDSAGKTITCRR